MTQTIRWPWLLAAGLGAWLLYLLTPILAPFLLAMLLAYMGDPLVDRLQRLRLSRTSAVVLVFAAFSLILLSMLLVLVPLLGRQLVRLYELAPQLIDWLQQRALPWVQVQLGLPDGFWRLDHVKQALSKHVGQTGDVLGVLLASETEPRQMNLKASGLPPAAATAFSMSVRAFARVRVSRLAHWMIVLRAGRWSNSPIPKISRPWSPPDWPLPSPK